MENFEKWLVENKNQINPAAYGLFEDSLRCMKFDIVRPAYLMAYQGMIRHIRDVIVFGERPNAFNEPAWSAILRDLTLDNPDVKWDDNTYDKIRQGADRSSRHPKVLNMPDEARNKFPYWRELRNVCAHNKEYILLKAHTITLYAFIEQFILRMSVEGGLQTLLNQLDEFYNPVLTPPGKDDTELLKRIPSMVEIGELKPFLVDVATIRKKYHVRDFAAFFLKCYDTLTEPYKDELKRIIEGDEVLLGKVLEYDPERVLTFVNSPEKIRKIWLHDSFTMFFKGSSIVAHLMEAGKLSESDKEEYFDKVLSRLYQFGNSWNEDDWVTEVFKRHGLLKKFLNEYFDVSFTGNTNNMSKICHSVSFYASMMNCLDVESDDVYVRHIVEVFGGPYPYTLRDWFKGNMMSDNEFATKLRQRVSELGLEMPKSIETAEIEDDEVERKD
jgi:hypothetical protein